MLCCSTRRPDTAFRGSSTTIGVSVFSGFWFRHPPLSQHLIKLYPIRTTSCQRSPWTSFESERFEPTASLDSLVRQLIFLTRHFPITHSYEKQQCAERRQAGSPTTSGGRTNGIPSTDSTQPGRDPGLRSPERDIVLPRTGSYPNDIGLGFGDTLSCHVSPSHLRRLGLST